MSSTYNGDGNSPTTQGYTRLAVTNATNANPIVITTSVNHNLTSGDTVYVEGVAGGNTNANGRWIATVLSNNTFSIPAVGNGAYSAGSGYVISYAVAPLLTIPSDGDDFTASAFNPAYQALKNLAPFMYERVGKYRLYNTYRAAVTDDTWAAWSSNSPGVFGVATWAAVSSGSAVFGFGSPAPITHEFDVLEIWANMTVTNSAGVGLAAIGLGVALDGGSYTIITGTGMRLPTAATTFIPISLHGYYQVPAAGNASQHTFDFAVMGYGNGGSPQTVVFSGHRQFTVNHLRPN